MVAGSGIAAVDSWTGFDYQADGRAYDTPQWFTAAGAVWVRIVPESEMGSLRSAGPMPTGSVRSAVPTPDHRDTFPLAMDGVTAPGADRAVVACAASAFGSDAPRTFPAGSTAVLADARQVRGEWHAVAVARAPGGAYLVGTCRRPDSSGDSRSAQELGSFVLPAPAGGPGQLLALLPTKTITDRQAGDQFDKTVVAVLAPEDAATVEVAGVTAQVSNRLAFVTLPPGIWVDTLRAVARRADGSVIGTAVQPRIAERADRRRQQDAPDRMVGGRPAALPIINVMTSRTTILATQDPFPLEMPRPAPCNHRRPAGQERAWSR